MQAHQRAEAAPAVLDDPDADWLVEQFRAHYHEKRAWKRLTWLGVPTRQYPNDLLVIQEVIEETRPELLIETGTHSGGSALFYAGVFDALGGGEVVTVDIDHSNVHSRAAAHPRVTLIQADSTSTATHEQLARIAGGRRTMLVLDGDHRQAAVAAELRGLAELVSVDCYTIVLDTNLGHPLKWKHLPGPYEAVEEFLAERPEFEADREREYHLVTQSPNGFLRRLASPAIALALPAIQAVDAMSLAL